MLQIISGKFFKSDNRHHNDCKGILYSNISWSQKIQTSVVTIEAADCYGNISSYVISYDNQIEKPEVSTGFELVKTGDPEIIHQLKLICSFALDAFFNEEKDIVYNACRQNPILSRDTNIPSKFIQRTLDLGLHATQQEIDFLVEFIDVIIGLPRKTYNVVINCIDNYYKSLINLDNDFFAAYSMMVYSLESLTQNFDEYNIIWDDYFQSQRIKLDQCFEGLDSTTVESIKNILLENENLKLSKRFVNFVKKNLDESFFTSDTYKIKRAIQKGELEEALINAYKIRSKYVHALENMTPQLKIDIISKESDVFVFFNDTFLTFSGLKRMTQKVIINFVKKQIKVPTENIDWHGELPGVLHLEPAPQYWIWQHEGLRVERIKKKYVGLIELIVSGAKELPDMRKVIEKCMELFKSAAPQDKRAIYCLTKLYNSLIAEEYRSKNHKEFLDENINLLDVCCIENLALISLPININYEIKWELETCEKIIAQYNKKKFDSKHIRLPFVIETLIYLLMANSYKEENNDEKQKEWLNNALYNCPGNEILQKQIKEKIESLDEFDISDFYNSIFNNKS